MEKPVKIVLVVLNVLIALMSIWFFVYVHFAVLNSEWDGVAVYIISGICMIVMGVFGIITVVKPVNKWLFLYIVSAIVLAVFCLIELILAGVSLGQCPTPSFSYNSFLCTLSASEYGSLYVAPLVILLVFSTVAAIFAIIRKKQVSKKELGTTFSV